MSTSQEVYAFRAAMRWAWNHPPGKSITILKIEFRERRLNLTQEYINAFQAANDSGKFQWTDPCATQRPVDKYGQPIWNASRLDTIRRKAWIQAAEALLR